MKRLILVFLVSSLILLTIFSFLCSSSRAEDFAGEVADYIVEQIFSEFFTLKLKPLRVGFHRGYFLYPWKKGYFLTIGYSFGVGAKGSFPYLLVLSFGRIFERVKFEVSVWYPAFQISSSLNIFRFSDGGILLGISSVVGYNHLLFLGYEASADLLVGEKQFAGYVGLRYMEPTNKNTEDFFAFCSTASVQSSF